MKWPSRQLAVQFLEYWIGGNVFFISGYGTFCLLYGIFHWNWLPAKILGDAVGWTLNYLVQRYWAFARKDLKLHETKNRVRYIILSVVDTVLDYLIVGGLYHFGLTPYLGMFVSAGFFTFWNFLWYRYWVFK